MGKTPTRLVMIIQKALHKCKIKMFMQKFLLTQSLVTFEELFFKFNVISYFLMHKLWDNLCKLNATTTDIATHNLILQGLNHKETFHKHGLKITQSIIKNMHLAFKNVDFSHAKASMGNHKGFQNIDSPITLRTNTWVNKQMLNSSSYEKQFST